MYRESNETLEDKIDFLINDDQYTEYAEWCEKQGYWTKGGA